MHGVSVWMDMLCMLDIANQSVVLIWNIIVLVSVPVNLGIQKIRMVIVLKQQNKKPPDGGFLSMFFIYDLKRFSLWGGFGFLCKDSHFIPRIIFDTDVWLGLLILILPP